MYSPAEFAPLSQASLKRLMKGHTVRVKHGSGLQLSLSKMQMKKHLSSKKKGQGGYNMTMDPYQCQMHGEGFLEDVGSAFKKMGSSFVENVAKPVASEVVKEGKRQGRKVASQVIHQGIPLASESLGGIAGATLAGLSSNPLAAEVGEVAGQQLGAYGGRKLADYVGKKTGLGMKSPKKLLGGTILIDQPFTARQAVDTAGKFIKDPAKTVGFGVKKGLPKKYGGQMSGGTALIDQPFTARQAVDTTGKFIKDPAKTVGFGIHKAIRQRNMHGTALHPAGY